MEYVYTAELTVLNVISGVEETLRFASVGFATRGSDTPAHTYFDERLSQPVSVTRSMFSAGTTYGRALTDTGDLVLLNSDGALDYLIARAFDGRRVTVRRMPMGGAYPADATVVFTGTMLHPQFTPDTIVIRVRDLQESLNLAVQLAVYAGTNSLPNGLEGTALDLKGKAKPLVLGVVLNARIPCVNTARLIYQVSSHPVELLAAVYDRGAPLALGAAYLDVTELTTTPPAPGTARVYSGSEGCYVRLGSSPAGDVTVDAQQFATASSCYPGALAQWVIDKAAADRGAVATFAFRAGDLAAVDAAMPARCGWLVQDQSVSYAGLLDVLAETIGGWWGFDASGALRLQIIRRPQGTPVMQYTRDNIRPPLERVHTNDASADIPSSAFTVRYARNWTVQDPAALAGSVTTARRSELAAEWREATHEDPSVAAVHLLAATLSGDTALIFQADALREAKRRQRLRGSQRHMFELWTALDADALAIDLGDTVALLHPRYDIMLEGDDVGRLFTVLGIAQDVAQHRVLFTLWGNAFDTYNRVTETDLVRITEAGAYRITE